MRVTRAFVASCGAGLCLVAAAVTALLLLSAVVAVRGWPGIDPEDDVQPVTLARAQLGSPAPAPSGGAVAVAASAGPAPIVLGAAPRAGSRGGPGGPGGSVGPDPARDGATAAPPQAGDGTTVQQPGSADSSTIAPTSSSPAPPGTVEQVTDGVAGAVRDAGTSAGGVTDAIAPGSGRPVTQVTDAGADAVQAPGQAVDGSVQDVSDAVTGLLGSR